MKIGFISDTHGGYQSTKRALEYLKDCSHIFHMGDVIADYRPFHLQETEDLPKLKALLSEQKNILFVEGNNDFSSLVAGIDHDITQTHRFVDLGELKVFFTHGHMESLDECIQMGKKQGANLICFGHSHRKYLKKHKDIIALNPGSTTLPRDGSPSFGIYEDGVFKLIHLDTFAVLETLSY